MQSHCKSRSGTLGSQHTTRQPTFHPTTKSASTTTTATSATLTSSVGNNNYTAQHTNRATTGQKSRQSRERSGTWGVCTSPMVPTGALREGSRRYANAKVVSAARIASHTGWRLTARTISALSGGWRPLQQRCNCQVNIEILKYRMMCWAQKSQH